MLFRKLAWKVIDNPLWSVLGCAFGAFSFFGIRAENIMELSWVSDAFKWTIWLGVLIFSIHNYYYYKRQVKSSLAHIQYHTLLIDAQVKTAFSEMYKDTPDVAYMMHLRTAQCYNRIDNNEMVRAALVDAFAQIKKVDHALPDEIDEIKNILKEIDSNNFNSEIISINMEIDRINKIT